MYTCLGGVTNDHNAGMSCGFRLSSQQQRTISVFSIIAARRWTRRSRSQRLSDNAGRKVKDKSGGRETFPLPDAAWDGALDEVLGPGGIVMTWKNGMCQSQAPRKPQLGRTLPLCKGGMEKQEVREKARGYAGK